MVSAQPCQPSWTCLPVQLRTTLDGCERYILQMTIYYAAKGGWGARACCLPGIPSVLQSARSDAGQAAVYAPRGAKFYELALVAIAFDPHGRRLQALSALTT